MTSLIRAAERCHLAIGECSVTRELYNYFDPRLDEMATLRRVARLHRGSGRYQLTGQEREAALEVIRCRFEERFG